MKKILLRQTIQIHSLAGLFLKLPKAHRILSKPMALLLLILLLIIPLQSHATTYTYTGNPMTETAHWGDDNYQFYDGPNPAPGDQITMVFTVAGTLADARVNGYADVQWSVTFGNTTLRKGSYDSFSRQPYNLFFDNMSVNVAGLPTSWTINTDCSAGDRYTVGTTSLGALSLNYPDPPYIGPFEIAIASSGYANIKVYNEASPGTWSVSGGPSPCPYPALSSYSLPALGVLRQ